MHRNLKYRLGSWARLAVLASVLVSYIGLGLLFFATVDNARHLDDALEMQSQMIRIRDGFIPVASAHNEAQRVICPFPWANTCTSWIDANKKLVVAFFYLGSLFWLYLWARFMTEWENSILARYVREVRATPRGSYPVSKG